MNPEIKLRQLTEEDLPFADSIREMSGWNQTLHDWRRLMAHERKGCFLAEHANEPAGVATTTSYEGKLAWIGMVLVHPDKRRLGVGSALLNHCIGRLQKQEMVSIKLDATPEGKQVYDKLGFVSEWGLSRWVVDTAPAIDCAVEASIHLRQAEASDIPKLPMLDQESFGVSRAKMLEMLALQSETFASFRGDGKPMGYGMMRPGKLASYLGPVVSDSTIDGEALTRRLIQQAQGNSIFWDIPDHNAEAVAMAQQLGFVKRRTLTRMFLGNNKHAGKPERVWALAAPEIG